MLCCEDKGLGQATETLKNIRVYRLRLPDVRDTLISDCLQNAIPLLP